jgi:hypothetical protein
MKSKKTPQSGFSTLEILLAMTILIFTLSGAVLTMSGADVSKQGVASVLTGARSLGVDSRTNSEALRLAQENLEIAQAQARVDYNSVTNNSKIISNGINYSASTIIFNAAQCDKTVTCAISWPLDHGRTGKLSLSSRITNVPLMKALGGNCLMGGTGNFDWCNPQILTTISRNQLGGVYTTGLNIMNKIVYIITSSSSTNKPDLLIYDATNLSMANPNGLMSRGQLNVGTKALDALIIARNQDTNQIYAHTINNRATGQFQIINVSNADDPSLSASSTFPGGGSPQGNSVYFYNNRVYVGLTNNADGPEFVVYDTNPLSGSYTQMLGNRKIGRDVNAIAIREQIVDSIPKTLAYLAVSANNPTDPKLLVLDVTDPNNISDPIGTYTVPGTEAGISIYLLENDVFLGRDQGTDSEPNFYIIDATNPKALTSCPKCNSAFIAHYPNNEAIKGIVVSGGYAFMTTGNGLRILNVSDKENIQTPGAPNYGVYLLNKGLTGLALDGNFVFATTPNVNGVGDNALYVFYPAPCQ